MITGFIIVYRTSDRGNLHIVTVDDHSSDPHVFLHKEAAWDYCNRSPVLSSDSVRRQIVPVEL